MKQINIARVIINKRKEKGITQDELANYIGVSKASISKWETGQSYPDIVLLPQLAMYFNISLDELMGYEPQMTDDDIRKLYEELSNEFATKPFDDVMSRCRDITKKYFSCFPLLYQIGTLFLNYSATVKEDKKKTAILAEAKELFVRVKTLCDSIELKQLALHCEAVCEMMLNNPSEVIALLENEKPFTFHPSIGVMLSQSYQMLGKTQEAKITLQGSIFDSIVAFFHDISPYIELCTDDINHFEEVCRRTIKMIEFFNAQEVSPIAVMTFYLTAAAGYLVFDDIEKSLTMLESYVEMATGDIFPLVLIKKDNFFTFVEEIQDKLLRKLSFGMPDLPRNEQSFRQNMIDAIIENPTFSVFANEPRYKILSEKLKIALSR